MTISRRLPRTLGFAVIVLLLAGLMWAAAPSGATISSATPSVSWTGGPFTASNPLSCRDAEITCDHFALTIVAPQKSFVVTIRIAAARLGDDIDLFVRDPNNNTIASSTTASGFEDVALFNPPSGTYTVVVQPSFVVPGAAYSGSAVIGAPSTTQMSNSYHGPLFTSNFAGVPSGSPASSSGLTPNFQVSFNYVGRDAAEPTVGVNRNNTAFFAAATFDFPTATAPRRLARTLVMRSTDKGTTWQAVSPSIISGLPDSEAATTFPPLTLDPYVYMDVLGANPSNNKNGRVFSVDLDLVCGANAIFSDDGGAGWTEVPLFGCAEPVNDHQTIVTAPPPAGMTTIGYPSMVYVCYNRVSDDACVRSNDGGLTWTPTQPAFIAENSTGVAGAAGSTCFALTGHLAADSAGRIFLPTGNCGIPRVAISADGGNSWQRVIITTNTPMADHEVSLAVDRADNIYAVWQDATFRLAFLSISTDHGQTWSTPRMITPPGVHEVNFPTITTGDPGRIAILFPGSQSLDFSDQTRPWNIYVVMSTDALSSNPTFTWTVANDPSDPVHRGDCGPGRCDAPDGGSMFDFLHIDVSPADGAIWGTASDTCVPNTDFNLDCVHNPNGHQLRPGRGVAIRQTKGPLLLVNR